MNHKMTGPFIQDRKKAQALEKLVQRVLGVSAPRVAFLFPGNSIDYTETLENFGKNQFFLQNCKAARINKDSILKASEAHNSPVDHELSNQVLIYTICCSICDYYKSKGISPTLVSGYSMGIYSAFYAAEAYTFETGLSILKKAFHMTKDLYISKRKQRFEMGVIIGLSENDIHCVFKKVGGTMDIASFNGAHSFLIVGEQEKVKVCLKKAEVMGAFKAECIGGGGLGYHTPVLREIADEFYEFLSHCDIYNPVYAFLSPITIDRVTDQSAIVDEIIKNMYSPIHWSSFINTLFNIYNISVCYEVGPGDSLTKMTRYINNKVKVHPFCVVQPGLVAF